MTRRRWEYAALTIMGVIIGILISRATIIARGEVRDDLRTQDMTDLKRALEQYFNTHEQYISPPAELGSASQPVCTTSAATDSWFFGASSPLVKEKFIAAMPHDLRESEGKSYRYCATVLKGGQAVGYTLEAQLEYPKPEGTFFDEDELRKFHYRIMPADGYTIYRLCGGEEPSCTPS